MPEKLPNIIFILTDDQGYWAMGCAGNDEIRTPNLDRLARSGTRFENFFCVSPVCSPARASILTGRIPSQHGIHDWLRGGNAIMEDELETVGELTEYLQDQPGYTDSLSEIGYACGFSGKWHLGDSHHPQKSFTFWQPHALGGGPYYNAPVIRDGKVVREPSYITDYITDNAIRFLESHALRFQGIGPQATTNSTPPFYLGVHYTAPHSPWDREHHPHPIYDEYFNHCAFDSIPLEPMHPLQVNSAPTGYTQDTRRPLLSGYFAAITAMDAGVGRILDWLEDHGLRENTLILFSSDNGMNMGHHGIFGKGNGTFPFNMYDTSVKVPMIISQPGHVPQGTVSTHMLSHYDVYPTLLDIAGISNPQAGTLPGRSFASLLSGEAHGHGEDFPERETVVVFDEYGPTRMIRTREWKYIHRYSYGPHELFDLVNDPGERKNLVDEPQHQSRIEHMKDLLDSWFVQYVDPHFDGVREAVTGKGQLTWAGPAGHGKKAFADDWKYISNQ